MKDSYGRTIDYMRISVTDRCNLRCRYCMPEGIETLPMRELLTFEEILQIVQAAVSLGITKIKITGGEPLVRKDIARLVGMIHAVEGVASVTMTTNGVLLREHLEELVKNGLDAVNISLDTMNAAEYEQITGRDELKNVLAGIEAAEKTGLKVKVNTVLWDNACRDELFPILQLAKERNIDVRYIELMPIGEGKMGKGLSGEEWLHRLRKQYPALCEDDRVHGNGPAKYYRIPGFCGSVGFINAVHGKFCENCNRIRLSSTGQLKPCLCYGETADLRKIVRQCNPSGNKKQIQEALADAMAAAIREKPKAHCFETRSEITEKKKMVSIGG